MTVVPDQQTVGMTTKTETEVLPDIDEDVSEFDGQAHYVRIKALMKGGVVVALCGKRYVPRTIANAADYPVCPKCKELMDLIEMMDMGE